MENNNIVTYTKLGNNGRFGNQLFQISSTIGIAKLNNKIPVFKTWDYDYLFPNINKYYGDLNGVNLINYNETGFNYTPVNDLKKDVNYNLNGYFQSYKYFEDIKDEIKKIFNPSLEIDLPIFDDEHAVFHLRRGDYLLYPNHHPVMTIEYYKNAIDKLKDKIKYVFIMSDDLNYCEKVLIPKLLKHNSNIKYHIFKGRYEKLAAHLYDFIVMSKMKNIVISNSTFSWWAAYLSEANIVISPKSQNWFGKAYKNNNTKDLLLDSWIKVEQ